MISLRRTLTWPKRRWRAGGFGIHSPFAFTLVTEVLAGKISDSRIDPVRAAAGNRIRQMALIYRCVRHFNPAIVAVYPSDDKTIIDTVRLACPKVEIAGDDCPTPPDMTIVGSPEAAPAHDNGSPVHIIAHIEKEPAKSLWKRLNDGCTRGMDFSDRRTGIICRFSHLPRQSFRIVFK